MARVRPSVSAQLQPGATGRATSGEYGAGNPERSIRSCACSPTMTRRVTPLPMSGPNVGGHCLPLIGLSWLRPLWAGGGTSSYAWCVAAAVVAALLLSGGAAMRRPERRHAAALGVLLDLACHYRRNPPRTLVLRGCSRGRGDGATRGLRPSGTPAARNSAAGPTSSQPGRCGLRGTSGSSGRERLAHEAFLERAGRRENPLLESAPPTMMMDHEVLASAGFPLGEPWLCSQGAPSSPQPEDHPGLIQWSPSGRLLGSSGMSSTPSMPRGEDLVHIMHERLLPRGLQQGGLFGKGVHAKPRDRALIVIE